MSKDTDIEQDAAEKQSNEERFTKDWLISNALTAFLGALMLERELNRLGPTRSGSDNPKLRLEYDFHSDSGAIHPLDYLGSCKFNTTTTKVSSRHRQAILTYSRDINFVLIHPELVIDSFHAAV